MEEIIELVNEEYQKYLPMWQRDQGRAKALTSLDNQMHQKINIKIRCLSICCKLRVLLVH